MKKPYCLITFFLFFVLIATSRPVVAQTLYPEAKPPTLYDFYEQFYPPTLDPIQRARMISDATLNDFRLFQNRSHNPYLEMRDEWFRLVDESKLAEKIILTFLYSRLDSDPEQFVRVLMTKPKDIEKYLIFESVGRFNRPWHNQPELLIDIHTHQGEFGMSYDSLGTLERSLIKADRKGLDGVVVTNHDVLICDLEIKVQKIKSRGKIPQDFIVIQGMEYTSSDAGHLLLIGLQQAFPPGMSLSDVCHEAHAQGAKVIVAHPKGIESMIAQNPIVDGVVYEHIPFPNLLGMIQKNGQPMPLLACSDSHFPSWYGVNATRVFAREKTAQSVIEAIGEGKVEPVFNPLYAKVQRALPRIGLIVSLAHQKNQFETHLARALGADYIVFGDSLIPSTTRIRAGFGKYAVSYEKNRQTGERRIEVRCGFFF